MQTTRRCHNCEGELMSSRDFCPLCGSTVLSGEDALNKPLIGMGRSHTQISGVAVNRPQIIRQCNNCECELMYAHVFCPRCGSVASPREGASNKPPIIEFPIRPIVARRSTGLLTVLGRAIITIITVIAVITFGSFLFCIGGIMILSGAFR